MIKIIKETENKALSFADVPFATAFTDSNGKLYFKTNGGNCFCVPKFCIFPSRRLQGMELELVDLEIKIKKYTGKH